MAVRWLTLAPGSPLSATGTAMIPNLMLSLVQLTESGHWWAKVKWGKRAANPQRGSTDILPGATGSKVVRVLFVPCADTVSGTAENTHIVDAGAVMTALRGDS